MAERIAKRIAAAGICSRREAEKLIEAGKVQVNGETITSPALNVEQSDDVTVNGEKLSAPDTPRLFRLHKPKGVICTHKDPQGRPTVFDLVPPMLPRVVSIGRLDLNSEGLLLLTTSPALAEKLMHPKNEFKRTYRVRVAGKPRPDQLNKLRKGMTVDGMRYKPMDVKLEEGQSEGRNHWVEVTLTEGKNRELRKVFEALGLPVSRLIRTAYGPFKLTGLPKRGIVEVPQHQVKKLLA